MPVPEGIISTSGVWKAQVENNPPEEVEDEQGVQVPTDEVQEDKLQS